MAQFNVCLIDKLSAKLIAEFDLNSVKWPVRVFAICEERLLIPSDDDLKYRF